MPALYSREEGWATLGIGDSLVGAATQRLALAGGEANLAVAHFSLGLAMRIDSGVLNVRKGLFPMTGCGFVTYPVPIVPTSNRV